MPSIDPALIFLPGDARARIAPSRAAAACTVIGYSLKTLRRRIADGALAVIRDGRLVRIHPADLQRYIQQHRYG